MRNAVLTSLLVAGVVFSQIACAAGDPSSLSQAELETAGSTKCGTKYQEISGEVTKSGISRPPGDCFSKECFEEEARNPVKSKFRAVLVKPLLNGRPTDKTILAYTPEEDDTALRSKPEYMQIGKVYSFCAQPNEQQFSTDELLYRIDDMSTIKEVK